LIAGLAGLCFRDHLVVPLDLFDEEFDHMVYLFSYLFDSIVILRLNYCFLQLWLSDLRTEHDQIKHDQQFEQGALGDVKMGEGFEGQVPLLALYWLIRCLLYELHADVGPMEGDGVALEHDQIGIFDVQFNGSDVLYADDSLGWHVLDQKFVFTCVF
jgi:hypothetical protein